MEKEYNTDDEKQIRGRRKLEKLSRLHSEEDIKKLLGTYYGRHFIWMILSEAGIYKANPYQDMMAFKEGYRALGLWVLNQIIEVDPNSYARIRDEAVRRDEQYSPKNKGKQND